MKRHSGGEWAAFLAACASWGLTFRFCLILVVGTACSIAPLLLGAWFLSRHGLTAEAIYQALVRGSLIR